MLRGCAELRLLEAARAISCKYEPSSDLPELVKGLENGLLTAQITELFTRGQGLEPGFSDTAATASGLAPSARLGSSFRTEKAASTDLQLPAAGVRPLESAQTPRLHNSR